MNNLKNNPRLLAIIVVVTLALIGFYFMQKSSDNDTLNTSDSLLSYSTDETLGEKVDEVIEDTSDAIDNAVETTKDVADKTVDNISEAADDAADAIVETYDDAKDSVEETIDDMQETDKNPE